MPAITLNTPIITCPCCGEQMTYSQLVEAEAVQELMNTTWTKPIAFRAALGRYFKWFASSKTNKLSWASRLEIAQTALKMQRNINLLSTAMKRLNDSMSKKATYKQFKNHNYLQSVLDDVHAEQSDLNASPRTEITHESDKPNHNPRAHAPDNSMAAAIIEQAKQKAAEQSEQQRTKGIANIAALKSKMMLTNNVKSEQQCQLEKQRQLQAVDAKLQGANT